MESKSQEPLNLPAGNVRAFLTTLLVGITDRAQDSANATSTGVA